MELNFKYKRNIMMKYWPHFLQKYLPYHCSIFSRSSVTYSYQKNFFVVRLLQQKFPTLSIRSYPDLYPLIRPLTRPTVLGRGESLSRNSFGPFLHLPSYCPLFPSRDFPFTEDDSRRHFLIPLWHFWRNSREGNIV